MTNYKDVKTYLETRGYEFESDTDTEVIAKLVHHLWKKHPGYSFRELVEQAIQQLVSQRKHFSIHFSHLGKSEKLEFTGNRDILRVFINI